MSLPPGFLDELRTRVSLSQVVGRKVMWDTKKSNQGKGDWWAPCPFHQEKSASFHVDDRKGYYYCFGCHAKGDAISFVQETENVGFMEAIEILAQESGMQMPARDPQAKQKADKRTQLIEVMEQAVKFFRLQLKTAAAEQARAYLIQKRGLTEAALDRWEIGFAPAGWQNLYDALTGRGVPEDLIIAAGLAKPSDRGKRPYDVFRDRIMFPIRDARGRAIAFGGRAMDPNDNAKYLNSPETELFDKGRNLYNHGPAREATGKDHRLILAEGYMDVIALSEAGFQGAVAPLGTAVTEHQLDLLWRMAPEPIVTLDGDTAGQRAAMRVIDLALPKLKAGQSLRFAVMPEGKDPDDLIRAQGPAAMEKVLDGAMPMVRLLWQREIEGKVFDSPERRAALDKSLREKLNKIADLSIKSHYGEAIRDLRAELWGSGQPRREWVPRGRGQWQARGVAVPMAATKNSALAQPESAGESLREAVVLAIFLRTPEVTVQFLADLEHMECRRPELAQIRDAILMHYHADDLIGAITGSIGSAPLENLLAERHVAITPAVRRAGDSELAVNSLKEEFAKLAARRGHLIELAEAEQDLAVANDDDEGLTWRVGRAALAVDPTTPRTVEDTTEVVIAENGLALRKEERDRFRKMVENLSMTKNTKPNT